MFAFLLNVYRGFIGIFDGIQFNGTSILLWGMVPFILTAVVRFVLPMLHIPAGFGILNSAGSVVRSAPEYSSNSVTNSTRVARSYTWDTRTGSWKPGKTRKVISRTTSNRG